MKEQRRQQISRGVYTIEDFKNIGALVAHEAQVVGQSDADGKAPWRQVKFRLNFDDNSSLEADSPEVLEHLPASKRLTAFEATFASAFKDRQIEVEIDAGVEGRGKLELGAADDNAWLNDVERRFADILRGVQPRSAIPMFVGTVTLYALLSCHAVQLESLGRFS